MADTVTGTITDAVTVTDTDIITVTITGKVTITDKFIPSTTGVGHSRGTDNNFGDNFDFFLFFLRFYYICDV